MIKNEDVRKVWAVRLVWILIGLGIFLRVNRYLHNFPFWGDEAWVAQEVIRRSFEHIVFNLSLLPSIGMLPLGFLLLEKFLVTLVDFREPVFRFFPCLCGVAGIFLFRKLLKMVTGQRVMLMALAFFVFSNLLIFYSSELKQYSSDVLFTILVLICHRHALKYSMDDRSSTRLSAAGIIALFFSQPVILVLCGVALVQVVVYLRRRQSREAFRYLMVLGLWLISFWSLWRNYYHVNYEGREVLGYKAPFYLSCPFLNGDWGGWAQKLWSLFTSPVEMTWPWLSALMLAAGIWSLWRNNRAWALTLSAPVILTIGLSMADMYPFHGRFIIFLVPLLFILIAEGVEYVMVGRRWRTMAGVAILAVLLARPLVEAGKYFLPSGNCDLRSLVVYLRDHQEPKDSIYLNNDSQWGYYLYAYFYYYLYSEKIFTHNFNELGILYEHELVYDQPGQLFFLVSLDRTKWQRVFSWDRVVDESGVRSRMPASGRTWILLSRVTPQKEKAFLACFDSFGQRLDEKHSNNSSLYLYDLK